MPERADWEDRWHNEETPWDLGGATPALVAWAKENDVAGKRVLVPGCGRGYDAHFLAKKGAIVTAVDLSEKAIAAARATHPGSRVDWRQGDVTALEERDTYDLVWEYTCLCALDRALLDAFIACMHRVLVPGGAYFGLTFHTVHDPEHGPPFQIKPEALRALLGAHFEIEALEADTTRSVKPRLGAEMWFVARRAG